MNDIKVECHLIFSSDTLLDLLFRYRVARMGNIDVILTFFYLKFKKTIHAQCKFPKSEMKGRPE